MTTYALKESLAHLLNRAGVKMASVFQGELDQVDLSIAMWRILAALWSGGEKRLIELEEQTGIDLSTLSRLTGILVKRKLIVRGKSNIDSRALQLSLSASGRALVERFIPIVETYEMAAFKGFPPTEMKRLKQSLVKVYGNLQEFEKSSQT